MVNFNPWRFTSIPAIRNVRDKTSTKPRPGKGAPTIKMGEVNHLGTMGTGQQPLVLPKEIDY
jgi:hypothetical protein